MDLLGVMVKIISLTKESSWYFDQISPDTSFPNIYKHEKHLQTRGYLPILCNKNSDVHLGEKDSQKEKTEIFVFCSNFLPHFWRFFYP